MNDGMEILKEQLEERRERLPDCWLCNDSGLQTVIVYKDNEPVPEVQECVCGASHEQTA